MDFIRKIKHLTFALSTLILLSHCGQSGPLTLPDNTSAGAWTSHQS